MNQHINWQENYPEPQTWIFHTQSQTVSEFDNMPCEIVKRVEINMHALLLRRWEGYWGLNGAESCPWLDIPDNFNISFLTLREMRQSREWQQEVTKFLLYLGLEPRALEFRKILGCPSVTQDEISVRESTPTGEEPMVESSIISARKYGIEIEIVSNSSHEEISELISDSDIPCQNEPWGSPTRSYWKTTTDSSIRQGSYGYAVEIVSPPLTGPSGLDEISKICNLLNEIDVQINKSCGLHVHVDADGLASRNIRNIVSAWMRYEPIIDSFQPKSRRKGNSHCLPLPQSNHATLISARSTRRIKRLANPEGRYYRLNLNSLSKHGTLEFRHHSGTYNAEKIIRNVQFCIGFIESHMSSIYHPYGLGEFGLLVETEKILDSIAETLSATYRDPFKTYYLNRQNDFLEIPNSESADQADQDNMITFTDEDTSYNSRGTSYA